MGRATALGASLAQLASSHAALWVAAGRARQPQGDLRGALAGLKLNLPWPNALQPAAYHWQAGTRTVKHFRRETQVPTVDITVTPNYPDSPQPTAFAFGLRAELRQLGRWFTGLGEKLGRAAPAWALRTTDLGLALPACLHHEAPSAYWLSVGHAAPWLLSWSHSLWPLHDEAWLAQGVGLLVGRIETTASASAPLHPYLLPLFEPDRPWTDIGMLLLWLAAASRDADLRRLAGDLLIEGIEDGRAHPAALASVLLRLNQGGWLKANRLVETLREVARISPLHQWTVASLMEQALAVFIAQPGKANLGLELLLELLADLHCGPAPTTLERLAYVGGGKAGNAAKALTAMVGRTPLVQSAVGLAEAWERRIRRLERWAG